MLAHADMDDTGPRQARGATERTCVVTRAVKPVDELIRFVVAPDGAVVPDLKRRLPGRGVWVTATRAARRRGGQAQGVSRAASSARCAPRADLGAEVERLLRARGARRAGDRPQGRPGRVGFAKAEAALAGGPVAAVLHAADGSADGARKIAGAAARRETDENRGRNPDHCGVYDRRNWIWHWGGQMWYMLPCSPAQRATGSSRAARASNASGPLIRADVARDNARLSLRRDALRTVQDWIVNDD